MKKSNIKEYFGLKYMKKFLLIMRLTFLFTILFVFNISAKSYSQAKKFNINAEEITLKELFNTIKQQSDFRFMYNNELVNDNQTISLWLDNADIEETLQEALHTVNLDYYIIDNRIIIQPKQNSSNLNQNIKTIKGIVTDPEGKPLPGATITIKGTTRGVITDVDGSFSINIKPKEILIFSFIGFNNQEIPYTGQTTINIQMQEKSQELDDVTVVAFGKQKQKEIVASISTIKTEDLAQSSGNLTTALAGRVPGMISFQTSGEPGADDANYFIRGITTFGVNIYPLVIVDQVEMDRSDLGKLSPDDIESFSILKDASATALYGTKGANGVILITTKKGRKGKVKINGRIENRFAVPTKTPNFVDGVNYMKLYNETMMSQYPDKTKEELALFSDLKIKGTERGINKYVYPNVDWYNEMFKKYSNSTMASVNMSGGGSVVNYYVSCNYDQQNGMLKKIDIYDNFNTEINIKRYNLRSNIGINVSPTTNIAINFSGTFEDYQGPRESVGTIFSQIVNINPVLFPMYYEPDMANIGLKDKRIFFGNLNDGSGTGASYKNPYQTMVSSVQDRFNTTMLGTLRLTQDLSSITEGLSAVGVASFRTTTRYEGWRGFSPYFYTVDGYSEPDNTYVLSTPLQEGKDYLNKGGTTRLSEYFTYFEGSLNYNTKIGACHDIKGLLLAKFNENGVPKGNAFTSLPQRNLGLIGRFNYIYDERYAAELNFGYYGSEKFTSKNRYGFFPSIGGAWNISEENFFIPLKRVFPKMKFRVSYGLVGNDNISKDRFVYLSSINTGASYQYYLGNACNHYSGSYVNTYANPDLSWEIARMLNFGFDFSFFNDLSVNIDVYKNNREGIYMVRENIPVTSGLPKQGGNIGEAESKGIDIGWRYNKFINNNFWLQSWGTFTYAKGTISEREEKNYEEPYRFRKGLPINQVWGYVADRLFIDDADAQNSPVQNVGGSGVYGAGDIKYRDVNGDYVVDDRDIVPIGFPSTPEINYGFGFSAGYKGIDFSFFLQGLENRSFFIDAGFNQGSGYSNAGYNADKKGIIPFIEKRNLLQAIANDHWSPEDPNTEAFWPRLTINKTDNNAVQSTWWLRDGGFMRLKNAEVGYTLPQKITNKMHINKARFYVRGSNLFLIYSKFDLWDPEQGGNGFGYPLQRNFNIGLNLTF